MKKKIFILTAAALLALSLAGCASDGRSSDDSGTQPKTQSSVKTFIDVTDEGAVANFDETDKGTGGGSGITIGEGEYLVIDSHLAEGKVQVKVTGGGSDINEPPTKQSDVMPAIDHEFDGEGATEYHMIAPGDYMVNVMVNEKATGRIDFIVKSDAAAAKSE